MRIHIPNSAFLGNINTFVQHFDPANPNELHISANKKWFFIHPVVLAMIASVGISLAPKNIHCEKLQATSRHYLQRMGLFNFLRIDSGLSDIHEHEPAGRFIPLTQIRTSQELTNFIQDVAPLLHIEQKDSEPVKYVLSEIIRNTLEHSGSKDGAIVCAQFYKKSNTIRIGIADRGVGIKKTINLSHDAKNDLEALRLALTPGITGMTSREGGTELNAGAGLFFIKSIACANRDFFVLYSGSALYKLLKRKSLRLHADPFDDKHSKQDSCPYWHGTALGIDISLDKKPEFSKLLDMIRDTYTLAIRERKKKRYKQARFI